MRREVHNGLKNVFTPSSLNRIGPCEKIYKDTTMSPYKFKELVKR